MSADSRLRIARLIELEAICAVLPIAVPHPRSPGPRTVAVAIPDPTLAGLPESLRVLVEEIFLDLPAVEQALGEAVQAAAAGIGLSCGITYAPPLRRPG